MNPTIIAHLDGRIEGIEEAQAAILADPVSRQRVRALVQGCAALDESVVTEHGIPESVVAESTESDKEPNPPALPA